VSNSSFAHTIKGLESKLTGYTMPVIIRAAWAILISRYTSSSDVVFGTTVMGRQGLLSAAEHIVGPTIATLPLRQKIDPRITVEGLLSKIHMQANEMVPFEHMGLSWIRRLLQNSGYNGDFQTLLVIQPKEYASPIRNAQLLFDEDVDNPEHGVNSGWQSMNTYAMTVECQLGYEDAVIRVSFDSKIIDQQQVKRIMKQLEFVIHQLCAHRRESSKLLADVDVTSEQDVQDIWKWNETHYESVNVCPHELISKTVRRQPDAIAICAWDGNFSYRQLEDLSDRLAFHLLDLGVKSTMILPLVFEKSKWTAVAQMATMKAGAAVVVMDPVTPQARLSSIVSQIDSRMILSSKQSHDLADNLVKDASVIVIDEENSEKWAPRPSHELPTVDPSSQLFLIFTS
jgi:non-ribosomal peptide synthetase component F